MLCLLQQVISQWGKQAVDVVGTQLVVWIRSRADSFGRSSVLTQAECTQTGSCRDSPNLPTLPHLCPRPPDQREQRFLSLCLPALARPQGNRICTPCCLPMIGTNPPKANTDLPVCTDSAVLKAGV